jgi:hypothetical protein
MEQLMKTMPIFNFGENTDLLLHFQVFGKELYWAAFFSKHL